MIINKNREITEEIINNADCVQQAATITGAIQKKQNKTKKKPIE